jgi:exosortase family protein XrtG
VIAAALLVLWVAAVIFLRAYRIWLPYYIVAAGGGAYWLVLLTRDVLGAETLVAATVATAVHGIAELIGVPTRTFAGAPGTLMVMVIEQEVGWTMLRIGVESSGLLEICVLASLLLWYPGWSLRKRLVAVALGGMATWAANLVRVLLIVTMLHLLGKDALVLGHAYVGKLVFFALVVGIYWYAITRTTLRQVAEQRRGAAA